MNPKAKPFSHWRALTPGEAVHQAFRALEALQDDAVFISMRSKAECLEIARRLEAQGSDGKPLYGLPFAVKDNIDVAGLPTTAACPSFEYMPDASAFAVARLEAAGAICIGKTNLDQFATGLVGVRSPYGIPKNTLRADLVPGGSSSGSAVAVGGGVVAFSLGTDTAGSGRVPAALNGIAGLKPSLGLLSATGVVPACRTLDTISIFAAQACDAAHVAAVAQAFDAGDFMSRELPAAGLGAVPPKFIAGIPRPGQLQFFGDADAQAAFHRDIATLKDLGGEIREVDFEPFHAVARLLYEGPWVAERYHATRAIMEQKPDAIFPVTRAIISGAAKFSAVDTFDAMYKLAELRRALAPVLKGLDILAVPSIPTIYTVDAVLADPVRLNSNLGTYTNFVNLLDLSAFSVPVGERDDGLPSSLTLIGKAGTDALLAGIADILQTGTRRPVEPVVPSSFVKLAVVGAHLSGMPLNHELTSRNAMFISATRTTNDYKLYALAGTVPPKPGLIRVADGSGEAIAIEIWAMSPEAYGSFVANIPAPLGIGTLRIEGGGLVQGFLVEAEALKGARDITNYKSWRAFVADRS